jgi:type IV pilus assembly protein PilV
MRSLRQIAGFAMIEVMVTVVIVAFGLLGIAGLISRSFVTEVEGTQRTQALLLLQDMASRLEANRGNVAAYRTEVGGVNTPITGYTSGTVLCNPATALTLADRDRCEWGRMLAGANEQIGTRNAGVLVGARGCVYEIDPFNRIYAVAIAWQGMTAGPAPIIDTGFAPNGCGQGLYGNENRRRVMTLPVRLGTVGA